VELREDRKSRNQVCFCFYAVVDAQIEFVFNAAPAQIELKSGFEQVGFHKQLHVAHFVGLHKDLNFDPSQMKAPVQMTRAPPPEMTEWQKAKRAKVRRTRVVLFCFDPSFEYMLPFGNFDENLLVEFQRRLIATFHAHSHNTAHTHIMLCFVVHS
jgi:hypothetical protein